MLAMANAKERDRNDWVELFASIDSRFAVKNIVTPEKSKLSMVEVVWDEKPTEQVPLQQQSQPDTQIAATEEHVSAVNGHSPSTNGHGSDVNGHVIEEDGHATLSNDHGNPTNTSTPVVNDHSADGTTNGGDTSDSIGLRNVHGDGVDGTPAVQS